jgi:hypothetical protein
MWSDEMISLTARQSQVFVRSMMAAVVGNFPNTPVSAIWSNLYCSMILLARMTERISMRQQTRS